MNGFIEWDALVQVVVAGLVIGAGIPALFALGLRLIAGGSAEPTEGRAPSGEPRGPVVIARPSALRMVGALMCFATVVGAVATGLVFIAAGGHS